MRTDAGSCLPKKDAEEARKQPDKQNSYSLAIREGVWGGFGELLPEQGLLQIFPERLSANPVGVFSPSLLYSGIRRKPQSLDGGDGIVKCMAEYLDTASEMDVLFAVGPEVGLDDWRQAKLAMGRDNMLKYTVVGKVKVFEEDNTEREVFIVPSSALVNEA